MIKGIGESLNVLRQPQPPSLATGGASEVRSEPKVNSINRLVSQHRLASYHRWAVTTTEQHQISANQVALSALTQIRTLLQQLSKTLHLAQQKDEAGAQGTLESAEYLRQAILAIDPRYQGHPLLDHHFQLISHKHPAALHAFVFKSVDFIAPKDRDERINIQLGANVTTLILAGGASRHSLSLAISPSLANLGINAELVEGELLLYADNETWRQLNQGVLMMGEGQRLPAGELRKVAIEPRYNWQNPNQWPLMDLSQAKSNIAKIKKVLKRIQTQIEELRLHQQAMAQSFQVSQIDLDALMQALHTNMQPTPFSYRVAGLMAQTNTNRHQVSALLGEDKNS